MGFTSFIQEISPKNRSAVSVSWAEIRKTIEWWSSVIIDSYLTGSYSRHTKIDPIDDLDIFFKVNFWNTDTINYTDGKVKIYITGEYASHQLKDYSTYSEGRYYISPIKLINHIGAIVRSSYTTTSEQNRNGECYTVYLSSKDLTIDCVPFAWVTSKDYLLIPSWWNNLYWKKTNPKTDEEKIDELNNEYDWKLKWVIKIMKYWNKNKNTWVKFKSYVLECLIYFAFKNTCNTAMSYTDLLKQTVAYIKNNVLYHKHISDLPQYAYMYYPLDDAQSNRLCSKLDELYWKLGTGEYTTIGFLEE